MEAKKPLTLEAYLEGRNKTAFGRACGFKHGHQIYAYLRRKNGGPPFKRIGAAVALRIVRASGGELTLEALLADTAPPDQREAA